MQEPILFLDMFPFFRKDDNLNAKFEKVMISGAQVNSSENTIDIDIITEEAIAPFVLGQAESGISAEFGFAGTHIHPSLKLREKKKSKSKTEKIFGSVPKGPVSPISDVTLESGQVTVRGEVFDLEQRSVKNGDAIVLSFGLTDYTGSIRVSKFLADERTKPLADAVKDGMYLTVSGSVSFNRFEGDISLDPRGIAVSEKPVRTDSAPEKRVELHLHTKMSAMDAVCDTKAAVKRAIAWGHPAIAITDHGVCQAFPDAESAAGDKIKIIYGVEGYYINDVDERPAVVGETDCGFDDELVVFDIETTGLDSVSDRITEIGAVIVRDGVETERFQTFADPGMPIPFEVSRLTGIRDSDVAGAPSQEQAVRAFLDFAGGRPLAAHNASFDVGFIWEACQRFGMEFEPVYADTLAMAQALLPDLRNHKLDTVAGRLGLPEFNHHRASDDAMTAALILNAFFIKLKKEGLNNLSQLNGRIGRARREAIEKRRIHARHIILLAKDKTGLRNLYKLVSKSHLEHFRRNPIMPKSLIQENREGLIIGSACEAGELFSLVADRRSGFELRRIAQFYDYLEIQPLCNNMFMLSGDRPKAKNEEELRDFNRRVVELGHEMGLPVVATGDVHFLDPQDEIFRRILLNAKEFDDANRPMPIYFRTTEEMLEEFSYLGEETAYEVVVKAPNAIADMCEAISPLPPKNTLFPPKIENSAEELQELVNKRVKELYGDDPPEIVKKRLEFELNAILSRNYDVVYMSAQKLVADSLKHGYLVGSRGSVGSSLVAYMSGITEVNALPPHYRCPKCVHTDFDSGAGYGCGVDMPDAVCPVCGTKYKKEGFDIPFETFMGFGGKKVPDIDLNFSGEYQANAHKYTYSLFGTDHVFKAGTIGTVAEKT
ncbi:MAG: PolC-type DNA polymerase III, partial [Oscillospiraceae bacterium]|nr:PolC-type DNA polymerase III [Oscillospiraceae bacterium]